VLPSAAPHARTCEANPNCVAILHPQRPPSTGNRDPKKVAVPFLPQVYSIRKSNLIQHRIVFDSRRPLSILLSQLPDRHNSGKNRRKRQRTSAIWIRHVACWIFG